MSFDGLFRKDRPNKVRQLTPEKQMAGGTPKVCPQREVLAWIVISTLVIFR